MPHRVADPSDHDLTATHRPEPPTQWSPPPPTWLSLGHPQPAHPGMPFHENPRFSKGSAKRSVYPLSLRGKSCLGCFVPVGASEPVRVWFLLAKICIGAVKKAGPGSRPSPPIAPSVVWTSYRRDGGFGGWSTASWPAPEVLNEAFANPQGQVSVIRRLVLLLLSLR